MDGRELVKQACKALNDSKVLLEDITVAGIDSATGKELTKLVNKFLDDIEKVPESREHLIPSIVLDTYNKIVDQSVIFRTFDTIENLKDVVFTRTKFPDKV